MLIKHNELLIRNAISTDAEQLCIWWNDGAIMSHAGFPNGVGDTPDKIRERLAHDTDETHRLHIIELEGIPIGEMNYRNINGVAEIGIKICDFKHQEKGYGTTLLSIFIDALFRYYNYDKVTLDTNLKNKRAQHVYENKLGFKCVRIENDAWLDQLGVLNSSVYYEMTRHDWFAIHNEQLKYVYIAE